MALGTLLITYPDHLIILGGDFQGEWFGTSDKTTHLRMLPFTLLKGPQNPTYTPPHHPTQATCIDHFLITDPHQSTTQTKLISTLPHAF